jgi:hypothetical protein
LLQLLDQAKRKQSKREKKGKTKREKDPHPFAFFLLSLHLLHTNHARNTPAIPRMISPIRSPVFFASLPVFLNCRSLSAVCEFAVVRM